MVYIHCKFHERQWTKDSVSFLPDGVTLSSTGIVINSVQKYHAGKYHCLSVGEKHQVTSTLFVAGTITTFCVIYTRFSCHLIICTKFEIAFKDQYLDSY